MFAQEATIPTPDIAWSLLFPFLVLAIGGILLITVTSVIPGLQRRGFPAAFTIVTAAFAGAFLIPIWNRISDDGSQSVVADSLSIDHFTLFVWGVILISVFLVAALFDGYLRREGFDGPEWYLLMMMSASGGMLMAASQELILTFLALEILSIAVYVLAALHLRRTESQEASFKYFILGAVSSALFLYGIALVYGATGSTSLSGIAALRGDNAAGLNPLEDSSLILAGMALILVGFAFKVSAVPFHAWTPDVYQGSPTPVVAYMASAVKVAGFAGLARVFWQGFGVYVLDWRPLLSILAVASLLIGSFLALAQTNVKRMLAYSSIGHAGFMLIAVAAVAAGGATSFYGAQALLFYMVAYTFMVVGSFGVMTLVGRDGDGAHDLDSYRGLSRSRPLLAGLLAVLLFGQAGIPFTSGFWAKLRVIAAAVSGESYIVAGVAVLAAVVAAVLYLRIVVSMFMTSEPLVAHAATAEDVAAGEAADGADGELGDGADEVAESASDSGSDPDVALGPIDMPKPAVVAIAMAAAATVVLGIFPDLGSDVLQRAAEALTDLGP